MWGKRPKRDKRLSKRETLGVLAQLMEQAEQEQQEEAGGEPEVAIPYYEGARLPVPPARVRLHVADVTVDNSAGPESAAGAEDPDSEPQAPLQQDLPAQRQGESSRHKSF